MHAVPTKRLLVYVAIGLVVLIIGTFGLLSLRDGAGSGAAGVVIGAPDTGQGVGASSQGQGSSTGGAGTGGVAGVGAASQALTTTTQTTRIWVQVAGAVRRPGVYQMVTGARVFEAVLEAGGFTDDADQEAIALAAEVSDGCRVYVPKIGESPEGAVQTPSSSSAGITGGQAGSGGGSGTSAGPVLLNSATLEQLDALPGIGPALAQQIVTYRETQGPFTSIEQLAEVPGIGPAKLEQLRPLVAL